MDYIEFHSHEQQDEFVYNLFGKQQNRFFLDISCGNPLIGNNSYALEKYLGWQGFCFDIGDCENLYQWSKHRVSRFIKSDATSYDLTNFLLGAIPKGIIVDYISLDVDAGGTNLAFQALTRILEAGVRFKVMTFEHECYIHGPEIQNQTANLLRSQGYVPLFSNVRLWAGGTADDSTASFEDWWIDPKYFDSKILEISNDSLYYYECVDRVKEVMNNQYQCHHNCCRAFPEEYKLFWNEEEQQQLTYLFSQMKPRGT